MIRPKIYLAGPDVFLPDALAAAARKKEILSKLGMEGLHPFDNEAGASGTPAEIARTIRDANRAMMRSCDAALANVTPFRGVSADAGTVYEIGFLEALGKPVFMYSNDERAYFRRVEEWNGASLEGRSGVFRDRSSMSVENFGLSDNLMFAADQDMRCSFHASDDPSSLRAFTLAAEKLAAALHQHAPAGQNSSTGPKP